MQIRMLSLIALAVAALSGTAQAACPTGTVMGPNGACTAMSMACPLGQSRNAQGVCVPGVVCPSGTVLGPNGVCAIQGSGGSQPQGGNTIGTGAGMPQGTPQRSQYSDSRLKKNVTPITDVAGPLSQLQAVRYEYLAPGERGIGKQLSLPQEPQLGFIAQDVAKVIPEAVSKSRNGGEEYYVLKVDAVIPLLVEGFKQQQAEIAKLKAEIQALKAGPLAAIPAEN